MEHAPHNTMSDADEIALFRDRCSELMGVLLDELARTPGIARTFGVSHMRHVEFGGRRPYRFLGARESGSGRWEIWMDGDQAAALRPPCEVGEP